MKLLGLSRTWQYIFLILCVYVSALKLEAKMIEPEVEINVSLKKDEVLHASINASKDSQDSGTPKDFTMRWTLYRNQGLVVLVRYNYYPYQFILYKDYKLNHWSLNLLDSQGINRSLNQPQLKIYFKGIDDPFNDEKTVVHFSIKGYGNMSFTQQ